MESRFGTLKKMLISDGIALKTRDYKYKSPKAFFQMCMENGVQINYSLLLQEYEACVKELINSSDAGSTPRELVKKMIDVEWVFKDFIIIEDLDPANTPYVRYTNPSSGRVLNLGAVGDIEAKYLTYTLRMGGAETLDAWREALRPHILTLKMPQLNHREATDMIVQLFSAVEHIKVKTIPPKTPPVSLEGCRFKSEVFIPWTKKDVVLNDLGPDLINFLSRVEDHEYLCAIIAARLLGLNREYTPYIFGEGGDGKSTFIRFLSEVVLGHVANLKTDKSDSFCLTNCIGKIFLFINDCNNPYILRTDTVKRITGGDSVSINIKHRDAIDRILLSTIIITSNKKLTLDKEKWCTRRARPFSVKPMGMNQKTDDVGLVVERMCGFKNEFINYCLQSLEKLGDIKTGYLPHHPSYEIILNTEVSDRELELRDFTEDLKFKFEADKILQGTLLRSKLRELVSDQLKDKYFMEDFRQFLERNKVKYDPLTDCYHHIALDKVENTNTKFIKPKLNTYRS